MDYSVKLPRLPDDYQLPVRLEGRLRYDADRGELIYRGFMTKCTYDELSALADDADYHRALERLFVLTSAEIAPSGASRFSVSAIVATIGAICLAAGALWLTTRHPSANKPASSDQAVAVTPISQP